MHEQGWPAEKHTFHFRVKCKGEVLAFFMWVTRRPSDNNRKKNRIVLCSYSAENGQFTYNISNYAKWQKSNTMICLCNQRKLFVSSFLSVRKPRYHLTTATSWNQLVKCEFEAEGVWRQPSAESESDPAGWWIMTLSSANESSSALNPFSKSIKRANKSRAVTGLPWDHSAQTEAALSGQQAQAGGYLSLSL